MGLVWDTKTQHSLAYLKYDQAQDSGGKHNWQG